MGITKNTRPLRIDHMKYYSSYRPNSEEQISKNGTKPTRRWGRWIMFADLIILAVIFAYFTNHFQGQIHNLGKPQSVQQDDFLFTLSATYNQDIKSIRIYATVENRGEKENLNLIHKKITLQIKLGEQEISRRLWRIKESWVASEMKVFSLELSPSLLERLFTQFPQYIHIPDKKSLINLEKPSLPLLISLAIDEKIILQKKISIESRKRKIQ